MISDTPIDESGTNTSDSMNVPVLQAEVRASPETNATSTPSEQIVARERSPREGFGRRNRSASVNPSGRNVEQRNRAINFLSTSQSSFNPVDARTLNNTTEFHATDARSVDARFVQLNQVQVGVPPQEHAAVVHSVMHQLGSQCEDVLRATQETHNAQLNQLRSQAEAIHSSQMAGMIQELENQHGAVMEQTQNLFQEKLNGMIQELQSRHTREIKEIRNSHDIKMEDVLRGYTEMSHQFEELKNRYNDLSHQFAIIIDERDNLREALGRVAPSHQEAPRVPCESSGFAPHPLVELARVGTSSSSNVPAVAFPPIPKGFEFGPSPKSGKSQDDPIEIHGTSSNDAISALQEQVQNIMDELGKRKKKRDKSNSSGSDSDSTSSSSDEYHRESKLMRLKAYDKLKVPGLPKSAAELRTWKNGLISQLVACCRSSERELLTWLVKPFEGEEIPSDEFPVLNRVIGSKILDAAKGTRFSIDFQALQERSVRNGVQVQGHMLIAKICKKFRLDKEKGMSLSQQHLLALKPQGNEIKDLEIFRDRVEFVLSGLETSDYPAESILRTWIYDCLKSIPRMSLRVDKYREASVGSSQRSFQFLWQSMIEIIDEAQYDQNATSILSTLKVKVDAAPGQPNPSDKKKNDKKEKKEKKDKGKKNEEDKPAAPVAPNPKPKPKGGKPKAKPEDKGQADPKGKASPKNEVVAGEKGVPCIFYPSGTCRRDPCPYVHDKEAQPKPKPKAKAAAVPIVPSAFALSSVFPTGANAVKSTVSSFMPRLFKTVVAATAAIISPSVQSMTSTVPALTGSIESKEVPFSIFDPVEEAVTWLGDTGAGRTIGCVKQVPLDCVGDASKPVSFSTGGGRRTGGLSCKVTGEFTGETECYLLEQSPWALSIGEQVKNGKAFIWTPSDDANGELPKPFMVSQENVHMLKVKIPERFRRYADEVRENVPLFREKVSVSHMPAELGPSLKDDKGDKDSGYSPSSVGDPEEIVEDNPSGEALGRDSGNAPPEIKPSSDDPPKDKKSDSHDILHLPKDKKCAVCQEAKQDALPARRVKGPHVMTDGKPSEKFGDRIHGDHIIVAKNRLSSEKKGINGETVCLVLYDDFTKAICAYPSNSKSTENCIHAVNKFIGSRSANELHSDNAPELEACARKIGLVPDPTVPYRKTAVINRKIRTLEDCTRCCLVQVGNHSSLWPLAIEYSASAMTLEVWNKIHDHDFLGLTFPFGSLVHYRPNVQNSKLGAKTSPGLFLGWRLESGVNWKGVYKVADLTNVSEWLSGKASLTIITTMTVVAHKDGTSFPLRIATQRQLEQLEDLPKLLEDSRIEEDLKEIEDEPKGSPSQHEAGESSGLDRHEKITFDRFVEFGPTPNCTACQEGLQNHTKECRERFDKLIRESKFEFPDGIPSDRDSWKVDGNKLIRYHRIKRKRLFAPTKTFELPIPKERIGKRVTRIRFEEGGEHDSIEAEEWRGNTKALKGWWTGVSIFEILGEDIPVPVGVHDPTSSKKERREKVLKQQVSEGYGIFIECCCDPNSGLGAVSGRIGVKHIRMTEDFGNLCDENVVNQLLDRLKEPEYAGVDLWGSLPCKPWTNWQQMNIWRYGKPYLKKLMKQRAQSRKMLSSFLRIARVVLSNGGRVHYEWPSYCKGWELVELQDFCNEHQMKLSKCNACSFGSEHFKPWTIATSSQELADMIDSNKCKHDSSHKHTPCEGSKTAKSAYYPPVMCESVMAQLFPKKYHVAVPCMPVTNVIQTGHIPKDPNPWELQDVFCGIHELIDRKVWSKDPAALAEAKKEAQGLIEAGTWDYDQVIPRAQLEADARKSGQEIAIGQLMTIMSWKNAESEDLKKLKARIVFRGDNVRTAEGDYAQFQEIKVIPTTIAGININLAFGMKRGHSTTQSDVVKAYIQSDLNTLVPTYVELPWELTPEHLRHLHRPCTRLWKSLYGHPESGGHWAHRFADVISTLGGFESKIFPSNFTIPKWGLLVTLYVDDMLVSGPRENHTKFWSELGKHLKFEEPQPVNRVLGRNHIRKGDVVEFEMDDFTQECCNRYLEITGEKGFKKAPTPYLEESTLPIDDYDTQGVLQHCAAKLIMKAYWLARLNRPDVLRALNELSRRITRWSRNDDRKLHRVMAYLHCTKQFRMKCKLDPDSPWELMLFTDADHSSSAEHPYSTSGSLLVIGGGSSYFPISFQSKRQTAVSRSTTEAEAISLATAVFQDAVPTVDHLNEILGQEIPLTCFQDNEATIAVVRNGWSIKLRHVTKTHKIDLSCLYDLFKDPLTFLVHCPTDQQAADVFTKNLETGKWDMALSMLRVGPPE